MSLDLEMRMRRFIASAPQVMRRIQTLEISHSKMTRVFNLWREPYAGITRAAGVTMEMLPCNMRIGLAGSAGHLDQKFDITLGTVDIEDIFREQLDRIPPDSREKIKIIYREYLSDDLDQPQVTAVLQAESVTCELGAASVSAVSPRLNMQRTGELYTPKDVPMLRGFC